MPEPARASRSGLRQRERPDEQRILLVEDEPAIAEAVAYALRDAGYDVDHTDNGTDALTAARDRHYDLMVLDLLLPGIPGLDVCRTLRAESDLPIVMLTARDTVGDRVIGLDVGADDYVTKPFSVVELVSRVRSLLRRRDLDRTSNAGARRRARPRHRTAFGGDRGQARSG